LNFLWHWSQNNYFPGRSPPRNSFSFRVRRFFCFYCLSVRTALVAVPSDYWLFPKKYPALRGIDYYFPKIILVNKTSFHHAKEPLLSEDNLWPFWYGQHFHIHLTNYPEMNRCGAPAFWFSFARSSFGRKLLQVLFIPIFVCKN
jgi:hypothetical protein